MTVIPNIELKYSYYNKNITNTSKPVDTKYNIFSYIRVAIIYILLF